MVFVSISLLYSLFMVSSCMFLSRVFSLYEKRHIGYAIDILFFCGFGLGFVAFIKQRVNKPNFNVTCTVAAIFLVMTLTKEGNIQAGIVAFDKVMQTFLLVSSGVAISAIISFTLWPKSAVANTKKELTKSMRLNSQVMRHITTKFMDSEDIKSAELSKLTAEVNASHKRLAQNLSDAAYELLLKGRESEYDVLVQMTRLSQKLSLLFNGLSSSVLTHLSLLNEETLLNEESHTLSVVPKLTPSRNDKSTSATGVSSTGSSSSHTTDNSNQHSHLVDAESVHNFFHDDDASYDDDGSRRSSLASSHGPATNLFIQFMSSIRSTMTEYVLLMEAIMNEMPFDLDKPHKILLHPQHAMELADAIERYSDVREKSLFEIYKQDSFINEPDFDVIANKEAEAASCGNFTYILEEVGNGLTEYIKILEDYQFASTEEHKWSFGWVWKLGRSKLLKPTQGAVFVDVTKNQLFQKWEQRQRQQAESARDTYNPSMSLKIWRSLRAFRRTDIQFAIKVGVGAAVFALPAFIESLRPKFTSWRGEWGLITFVIVMNKSVGGTTITVPVRILGTFLGSLFAYICWMLFPENNIALPFLGWLLSFVCFWIILTWPNRNMFGQFILLTFNLTVLYSYSISVLDDDDDDDDDLIELIVRDVALHRFLMVCAGVLWALFISTVILPNSARRKLKRGLSILWLQMGLVWKADALKTHPRKRTMSFINGTTSIARQNTLGGGPGILTRTGTGMLLDDRFVGIQGETEMQMTMVELNSLLALAPNEIRLKGPFPTDEYKSLLRGTQQILDVFQDISVLIAKDPKASSRELEIIEYTTLERQELCSRIFLNFYLLSSAMRLGFPLPDRMPSTEHAIDRMLTKLNDYRAGSIKSNNKALDKTNDFVDPGYVEDFILFYSYILATIMITERLAELTMYIQSLFGVIEEEMFDV